MARYLSFVVVSLLLCLYSLWYLATLTSRFNRLIYLKSFLFHGDVDPTLLDSRVTYQCNVYPSYLLSSLSQDA